MKTAGKVNFKGHNRTGCPRCCGDSPMTETLYRGNGGVMKACCVECEPGVLAKKKRDTDRVRMWRQDKTDIKSYRAKEARDYRKKCGEKVREYRRNYYQENKDDLCGYRREYIKMNPWFNRAASSKKRAIMKKRVVPWSDLNKVAEVYRNCPEGMVVDHIIPLKGKDVSGLHVHTNLQYLTPEANTAKSNKFDIHSGRG